METPKESASCLPTEKNSLLISEVKKFSALYDTSDPNYYILAERNKAWLKVAANCGEPAELCHLRWKSLRKRFAKEKRKFPDILQGRRRPWALFPKMSFLTPATVNRKLKPKQRRRSQPTQMSSGATESLIQQASDDDMLILDDNDEIVKTCKSVEMSDDEYIYETLDDPDSALEIMKDRSAPMIKATAIRSGGPASSKQQSPPAKTNPVPRVSSPVIRSGVSGRIRKLTPRMQNSMMAKKLKQAQQILQQSSNNNKNSIASDLKSKSGLQNKTSTEKNRSGTTKAEKSVLYQDRTTRHVATVNPNMGRFQKNEQNGEGSLESNSNIALNYKKTNSKPTISEENQGFKMLKIRGRNPIILSPDQYADMQSFLKHDSTSPAKESSNSPPYIKVKSVDNLNGHSNSLLDNNDNNLDIIHSVGLMRKGVQEKPQTTSEDPIPPTYSRTYSWNRPINKSLSKQMTTEKTLADSQTNGYEIEEAWNEIKEEINEDGNENWPQSMMEPQIFMNVQDHTIMPDCNDMSKSQANRLLEAKLSLVSHQHKILEEQNKKTLEYMKKEHDMKMRLLEAEIEFKRKQLNIML